MHYRPEEALFCGEEFVEYRLLFDRPSLTRWPQRMGKKKRTALFQDSWASAVSMGAATGLKQMGCRGPPPHLSAAIFSIVLGPVLLPGDMSAIRHSLACRHY